MAKQTIAVLFGGQSSEHEVSCMSAANVIDQIDRAKYDLILVGITQQGHWVKVNSVDESRSGGWRESRVGAALSPDAAEKCLIIHESSSMIKVKVDMVFPVLHGLWGEDGTVQGLCRLAEIPYVGCGVAASAVCMDKGFTYPVFVKPCNAGSSCGVVKAHDRDELAVAFREAARYDRRILVEEAIVGREIECAVLGGGEMPVQASGVGEILAAADFYDYEAKYFNAESKTVVDPELPGDSAERVREAAVRIFNAVDGYGLSRVDFFVTAEGEVVFNEINTMPGFTAISMYPMLWEARGLGKKELIQTVIDLGFAREN